MLSDLMEVLRCPAGHENGYLVATVEERMGRYVRHGRLACPRCRTQWEIRDFRADFGGMRLPAESARPPAEEHLLRLAAQLDLRAPGGFVLLCGAWAAHAAPLAAAYDVHAVVLNAPAAVGPGEGTSFLDCAVTVPLAGATLRGAVVDEAIGGNERLMAALTASLRPGARVVAPASCATPARAQLLARDEREWVAEIGPGVSAPVPLSRAGR